MGNGANQAKQSEGPASFVLAIALDIPGNGKGGVGWWDKLEVGNLGQTRSNWWTNLLGEWAINWLVALPCTTQMAEQQTEQSIVLLLPNEMANDVS